MRHTGWTTRQLRPILEELEDEGLVQQLKRNGYPQWGLTDTGRTRANQRDSSARPLPESSQHRSWREARTAATKHLPELKDDLRAALNHALKFLDAEHQISSDTWFELSDTLKETCSRVGSATYGLNEWQEPSDDSADIDILWHKGRRNFHSWTPH